MIDPCENRPRRPRLTNADDNEVNDEPGQYQRRKPLRDTSETKILVLLRRGRSLPGLDSVGCPAAADVDAGTIGKAAVITGQKVHQSCHFGGLSDPAHGNATGHVVDQFLGDLLENWSLNDRWSYAIDVKSLGADLLG